MTKQSAFPKRKLRICYWNSVSKIVSTDLMQLETHLKQLGTIELIKVETLEDPNMKPCDLLIVAAQSIDQEEFPKWMNQLKSKIYKQGHVWTPALIFAEIPFYVLQEIWHEAVKENWYFDILTPAHIESIPIRVANILRIHDHLHELYRYEKTLDEMSAKVSDMENKISKMTSNSNEPS